MFDSVSALPDLKKHYVLMTGMGSDGAKAMAQAKRQGAESTIAEAQDSCVVFGMPRAAISLNCVDHVVPVTVIAAKIRQLTKA
ncbi:Chemotaxis response regulator protein-glutamate methylesterase of group 3 operon [compost metagenome]